MAAGVKKLTIGGEYTAEQAVGYLADPQARGDYYTESGSALMFWLATPRSRTYFGLGETVSRSALTALLNGQHPVLGQLVRRPGPDGTMVGGIDVTVSPAPKSVSALWALADDELRAELELMVGTAVHTAVNRMLRFVPMVRDRYGPGPRDVRHVRAQDWVGVEVFHTTARLSEHKGVPDPQLHVHNVLMGALDYAGRLRALDSRQILLHRAELDAEASSDLAEQLRRRGFTIRRELVRGQNGAVKRVAWEIKGVPAELLQAMSSRRREVEDLRQRYREVTGREAEGVGWERFLEQHRGPKAKLTAEEMREAWEAEGRSFGFGPEEADSLRVRADEVRAAGVDERGEEGDTADQLRREILGDLCREHALVPGRELDKLVMQRSIGLMDPITALGVVARMFGAGDLLATTDGRVTTLRVLAAEQRATAAAAKLLAAEAEPAADREQLEQDFKAAEEAGRPFDQPQRHAVELATAGARLVSIAGPAGTGKGFASSAMVAAWQRQGRRIIVLAVAGRTAQQAKADSGAEEAYTLDGLSARVQNGILRLGPRDVLLVDEAAMVDHDRYAALLEAAAEAQATVVQVGDDRQLAPVGPGGLWTLIHSMAEARDQVAELRVIRRARDPREAQAWTDLREGRVEEALTWYRDQGRLRLYDTRPEMLAGLVDDWWAVEARGVMVVDSSNTERDHLNRLAQARRLKAGDLGPEALTLANGREVRAGDQVLFNAIYQPPQDRPALQRVKRVENGTAARVVSVDLEAQSAVVELAEPEGSRQLTVPCVAPLELGYARHIAKGQGMTADVAHVATGPQTAHNHLYTMVTRSRDGSRIHALRAELEEMGAETAVLETREADRPAGAMTVAEYLQQSDLLAELRHRERELVTIREMATRAARSTTKEAIGARAWSPAAGEEARREAGKVERAGAKAESAAEYRHDVETRLDARQVPTVAPNDDGRSPVRGDRQPVPRRPTRAAAPVEPLPAASAMESMARARASEADTAGVLAYYQLAGQLNIAADPAVHAARRWLADHEAVIVVHDQEQEQRVRAAARELQAGASDPAGRSGAPSGERVTEPSIVLAETAYQQRQERRQRWRQEAGVTRGHLVEPDVTERAYVLAPPVSGTGRYDAMTKALSVAAESHLISPPPDAWTAAHARTEFERIRASVAAHGRAEAVRQATVAAELESAQGRDRAREAERAPSRQMETV